ncbi:MAG: zinc dependent phospholipase C family protein, partial [Planctomycetota bacterium]
MEQRIVPFKPYTHIAIVTEARNDLIDDGKITIEGNSYTVPAEVVSAIRDNPDYFNAGAVGPDGFPDIAFGQSVIHPKDSGLWLDHILTSARAWTGSDRPQVLAWSYGFLTHAIGDMWAHTLVNEFTGGPFPETQELASETEARSNALKHVIIEGYIADATPGYDGNPDRTTLPDGDVSNDSTPEIRFAAPNRFIYETFIKDGSGPAGNTEKKGMVIDGFKKLRDKLREIAGPK